MAAMDEAIITIRHIIEAADIVVIIQADNPDADSLASALALEQILHDLGKQPLLYCAIDMPAYLKYLPGWDRVSKDMPTKLDASIIVDTSSITLLERLDHSDQRSWVADKPCIVIDHHAGVACDIPFATVSLNDPAAVSTGEVLYGVAKKLDWPLDMAAKECVMTSILADSLGLTSENTTAQTYRIMAELAESGVSRPKLEELRRAYSKMPQEIFRYKAELLTRTEFTHDGTIAIIVIPQEEINEYSPLYNPNPLIQGEHLQTAGVLVSIAIKSYDNGRVTAGIRCNANAPIAAKLAERFGGNGHAHAAGFKIENAKPVNDIKNECIAVAAALLDDLPKVNHEITQHSF